MPVEKNNRDPAMVLAPRWSRGFWGVFARLYGRDAEMWWYMCHLSCGRKYSCVLLQVEGRSTCDLLI